MAQVTDSNTARILQYVPDDPAPCATLPCSPPADTPAGGEYRVLTEDATLTDFRLYGPIATGTTAFTEKFVYAITSDTANHELYRMNILTGDIDSKSLINFPLGWEELSSHTTTKWRYKLPVADKASHPCRCTSSDTDWKQGSGLPWQWDTGTTLVDGATRFETATEGLAFTLTDNVNGGATPWAGAGGLDEAGCDGGNAVVAASGCGMSAAEQTAFLGDHTVNYYPTNVGNGQDATANAFCAVLEPRLCSMPSVSYVGTAQEGTTRDALYVDMCAGATAAEEPSSAQELGANGASRCILEPSPTTSGCCTCTYGLCAAAIAGDADPDASFQLDFEESWAGAGWQGIQLAPYTVASPRPDAALATSPNDAQRLYAVVQTYGVVKYDLAADGHPTFVGTVLQCEDHTGGRMVGTTAKLTFNAPGDGHAEGMFVVCGRRNSAPQTDAAYLFYCALDIASDATWREQGRCAYVAGLEAGVNTVPDFSGGLDAAKLLNTESIRDVVILNAVETQAGTVRYDLATVEKKHPDSKMYRYSVTVTHGTSTTSPTVTAVSSVEFLDGNALTDSANFQGLKTATERDSFDFWAAAVEPDDRVAGVIAPKAPPADLYITDYTFNAIVKVPYGTAGAATAASATMFGTKSAMVPAGVPMFINGPVASRSSVDGIRDSVAGHTVYVKITALTMSGSAANEDDDMAAHIEVAVTGQVSIGGQDVTVVIPGTVVARDEDIYTRGCGGACPQNVFWAYYIATQAGEFSVSVTMGPFEEHVVGSPQTVTIAPTAIDPHRTIVTRDGDANVRAGNSATIFISTFDRFGNKRTVGLQNTEQFKWSLKNNPESMNVIGRQDTYETSAVTTTAAVALTDSELQSSCERSLPTAAAPTGADTPYWQGEADYRAYRAGTYQFQVILEIGQASYNVYVDTVQVVAATIDHTRCRADSPDFSTPGNPVDVVITTMVTVEITPRDRYSNPVTSPQTFIIDRQALAYESLGPQPLECAFDAVTAEYNCNAEWEEEAQETYTVKFYLDEAGALGELTSTELDELDPSSLIGTGWADAGGGVAEVQAVSKDGAPLVCESMDNINMFIQLVTAMVICVGLGLSVWLSMARTSSFIRMTSPVLGQVIIWGGVFHLFSVLLWTIDPGESGWPSDGFNFCSLRMWMFAMSFAMIWGTLALKTYRVKELVLQQAENASGYQEITDGKLLSYTMLCVFAEMVMCSVYSFYDDGPQYVLTPCGNTLCNSGETFYTFAAMLAVLNGAIVVFAITQAIQTRGVMGRAVGGGDNAGQAQNSAAAFVEAPHIGFSIYNMAFTSIVLYPVCGLIDFERSPVAYSMLRSAASIWSCFIVFVFVFGLKIRDKNKFDAQEKVNRSQKMQARQSQPQQQGSYSDGGTHSMRGGGQPSGGQMVRGQSPGRGGGGPPRGGGPVRGTSPGRGGGPPRGGGPGGPGGPRGRSPQRGGPPRGGAAGGRAVSPPRGGAPPAGGENWA